MMFIASLIESFVGKTRMWQKHNIQLANFDVTSLRIICRILTRYEATRILRDQTAREAMPDTQNQGVFTTQISYGMTG
jgi:hypothetical protein